MPLFKKKKTVTVRIGGMHCEKCAAKVASALKPFGKAEVDHKLGRAILTCSESVTADEIRSAVEAVGFEVTSI